VDDRLWVSSILMSYDYTFMQILSHLFMYMFGTISKGTINENA
jgi:hypothetical protein